MIKKHSLFYYSHELKQCIETTAGLLTDSHLEAFPVRLTSGKEVFQDVIGASQQRDCPGFSPDSLLIRADEHPSRNRFPAQR